MKKELKNNSVDKSYQLTNSKYRLKPTEIKLVLSLLSLVREEDEEFKEYKIPLSNLRDTLNVKNGQDIKMACLTIMSKPLCIQLETGGWKIFNWFSGLEFEPKSKIITARIDRGLKPYLLNLKGYYSTYKLRYILGMKSSYSIRLYEILNQRKKLKTYTIGFKELGDILVVSKSLKTYAQFKRDVLLKAQVELKEQSDLRFEFKEIKTGRRVDKIKFSIFDNKSKYELELEREREFYTFVETIREYYQGMDSSIGVTFSGKEIHITKKGFLIFRREGEDDETLDRDRALEVWRAMFDSLDKLDNLKKIMETTIS